MSPTFPLPVGGVVIGAAAMHTREHTDCGPSRMCLTLAGQDISHKPSFGEIKIKMWFEIHFFLVNLSWNAPIPDKNTLGRKCCVWKFDLILPDLDLNLSQTLK